MLNMTEYTDIPPEIILIDKGVFTLMKKCFLIICTLILASVIMFLLAGCSGGMPDSKKVMSDLNLTDYISTEKLNGSVIPITSVKMIDVDKQDNYCVVYCTVTQEDDHFVKQADVTLYYNKNDEWMMSSYQSTNESVVVIAGVPDEVVERDLRIRLSSGRDEQEIEIKSIEHQFPDDTYAMIDSNLIVDRVTSECVVTSSTCIKTVEVRQIYKFDETSGNEQWKCDYLDYFMDENDREWRIDNIEGSLWQGRIGVGIRTIKINNIDLENKTIDIDYGYSSAKTNEKCTYRIEEYQSGVEDKQKIYVDLTYDFYNVAIDEDGSLWYGGYLNRIE